MQIIKLNSAYILFTDCGSVTFSKARFDVDFGMVELKKDNVRVFIIYEDKVNEFIDDFIEIGGVMS